MSGVRADLQTPEQHTRRHTAALFSCSVYTESISQKLWRAPVSAGVAVAAADDGLGVLELLLDVGDARVALGALEAGHVQLRVHLHMRLRGSSTRARIGGLSCADASSCWAAVMICLAMYSSRFTCAGSSQAQADIRCERGELRCIHLTSMQRRLAVSQLPAVQQALPAAVGPAMQRAQGH